MSTLVPSTSVTNLSESANIFDRVKSLKEEGRSKEAIALLDEAIDSHRSSPGPNGTSPARNEGGADGGADDNDDTRPNESAAQRAMKQQELQKRHELLLRELLFKRGMLHGESGHHALACEDGALLTRLYPSYAYGFFIKGAALSAMAHIHHSAEQKQLQEAVASDPNFAAQARDKSPEVDRVVSSPLKANSPERAQMQQRLKESLACFSKCKALLQASHPDPSKQAAITAMRETVDQKMLEAADQLRKRQFVDRVAMHAEAFDTFKPLSCRVCHSKRSHPTPEWYCPTCFPKKFVHIWQPDDAAQCGCCDTAIGKGSRHHCRCCGRLCCGDCSKAELPVPLLQFEKKVRVCAKCAIRMEALKKQQPAADPTVQ